MSESASTPLLAGLRVIELATMVFAPSACVILAEFGAEIIKVEEPRAGDLNRGYHKLPGMPVSELAYTFEVDNRNKKSVALDLKTAAGHTALLELIRGADVFVTNLRPQVLERLRLDYDALQSLNSRLIYAHASGYGEQGAEREKPGYDTICYWSRSGIEAHVFPYEGWLSQFPFGAGDHPSGMTLFAAIMTALYRRQQSGAGCKVSSSLLANGTWANATMLQAQLARAQFQDKRPRDNAWTFTTIHYRSRDDRLLKMGIVNIDKDWRPFCQAMELTELITDPRFLTQPDRLAHMQELIAIVSERFLTREMAWWQARLAEYDIPHALMANYPEAADDPQKAAIEAIVPMLHPQLGQIRTVSSPFLLSDYEKVPAKPAPGLGQHTREVLTEIGLDKDTIEAIVNAATTD
jgi:crotonobetainyl-CoA:carnitine CoA-transferase CaiB-like acyl-CoA transferase